MAPTRRPRPLLSIRLVGPAHIVTAQKAYLVFYYAKAFRDRPTTCRTSTHAAKNAGEIRVYLTVTAKENP
jgi:hypothetical protein